MQTGKARSPDPRRRSHSTLSGGAVIMRWDNLPMEVQRELFASAVSLGEPLHMAELKEQIARFLHSHKNV